MDRHRSTVLAPAAGGGLVFLVEPDTLKALHGSDGSVAWETCRLPNARRSTGLGQRLADRRNVLGRDPRVSRRRR
jgi:hypothetical protein